MNQLILPYQKNTKQTFSNFIRSNKLEDQIINNIKEIFFSSNNQLYLWSNTSCGKSHILYSACNYFGNESNYIRAHEKQQENKDKTNNEYYLAPVYNYIDEDVGVFRVDEMLGMGTPEELNNLKNSEWWDKLDSI